jgi:hypothetical protein
MVRNEFLKSVEDDVGSRTLSRLPDAIPGFGPAA